MGKRFMITNEDRIYRMSFDADGYDVSFEIRQIRDERIVAKFNDQRWRSVAETQKLFRDIADSLNELPTYNQ